MARHTRRALHQTQLHTHAGRQHSDAPLCLCACGPTPLARPLRVVISCGARARASARAQNRGLLDHTSASCRPLVKAWPEVTPFQRLTATKEPPKASLSLIRRPSPLASTLLVEWDMRDEDEATTASTSGGRPAIWHEQALLCGLGRPHVTAAAWPLGSGHHESLDSAGAAEALGGSSQAALLAGARCNHFDLCLLW